MRCVSQDGMRECLQRKVSESDKALHGAEDSAVSVLKLWDEEAAFVSRAEKSLRTSRTAFLGYREAQCGFAASLGGGAIPNALELRKLACIYAMNTERTMQLKRLVATLPRQ